MAALGEGLRPPARRTFSRRVLFSFSHRPILCHVAKYSKTVDLGGSLKSIEGARSAGVKRFVQISAISVDEPVADDVGESWAAYVEAKRDADIALRDSDLDWTIIRPGGLTDDEPTGKVHLAESVEHATVPRADVAAVIAAALVEPGTIGKQWELVSGDTPIAEAITSA